MAVEVDVYSDVACPWCYLGKRRLERAVAQVNGRFPVRVEWRSFELRPRLGGSAAAGSRDAPLRTEAEQDELLRAAYAEGVHFSAEGLAQDPPVFDAHRLIWFARQAGRGEALIESVFRASLCHGRDIGQHAELERIGEQAGLGADRVREFLRTGEGRREVEAEMAAGQRLGLSGVPALIIDGNIEIIGARPPEELTAALEQAAWEKGLLDADPTPAYRYP